MTRAAPGKKRFLIRQKRAFSPALPPLSQRWPETLHKPRWVQPFCPRRRPPRPGNGEPPRPCRPTPAARRAFPASAPESPANRQPRVVWLCARPAPPRPPRGLCAPHAAKPARARLPAAARKEGSGSPRPGTAPCPRRPGKSPPASSPARHTAVFSPRPPDSGTAAAPRRCVLLCPQGGIKSLGCTGRRPRPPLA